MAKMTIKAMEEYEIALSKLGKDGAGIAKKAVYSGAKVLADEVRQGIKSLPDDNFRHLEGGEKFSGVPKSQKKDLLDSFGIAPITVDNRGNTNTRVGFDGYGTYKTKAYPGGLPNQLLARAIESGSSVRKKTPFVRKALTRVKERATKAMEDKIDEEIQKIMRGD